MSNGIKQGGILSPELFNIYVDVLSTTLNEKYIGCSLKDKVVNHLYYADDLVLVSPTASGMNELIQEWESFLTEYGLKFNETKLFCYTLNLSISKSIHVLRSKWTAL